MPNFYMDIDGVLNLINPTNKTRRSRDLVRAYVSSDELNPWIHVGVERRKVGNQYLLWLDRKHPDLVGTLREHGAFVWATMWNNQSRLLNEFYGLPVSTPYVEFYADPASKMPYILNHAQGEPFVWFDDNVDNAHNTHYTPNQVVRISHNGWAIPINPKTGLEEKHIRIALQLMNWEVGMSNGDPKAFDNMGRFKGENCVYSD